MIYFLPLLSKLSIMETPFQMSTTVSTGLSLPLAPCWRPAVSSQEGLDIVFLFLPQITVAKATFWVSAAENGGSLLFPSPHQWDGGATLVVACWRILAPQSPSSWLSHKADVHARRGKLRRPKATAPSTPPRAQLLKQGWHLERRYYCPHPQLQSPGLEILHNQEKTGMSIWDTN